VVFRNGDRLTGRVVHKHDAKLVFETAHAGRVSIGWNSIRSLATDRPVAVMLRDGEVLITDVQAAETDERVRLRDRQHSVRLDRIAYLNPTPEQSGIGILYNGRASLSATNTQGNNTSRRVYAEAEMTARTRDYRYSVGGKMNRQREFGQQTASNWRADGNYDWFFDQRKFRYVRSSFEHDRFKDIDLRGTVGGGYGLQLIDSSRTSVSIRGGVDYVNINHTAAANENYPALGWGLKASHRLDTRNIELFHEQDGFLQIGNGGNITLRSRTGLRVPIASGITASAQANLDWEREPAPGRKSTDSTLLIGLGYEW